MCQLFNESFTRKISLSLSHSTLSTVLRIPFSSENHTGDISVFNRKPKLTERSLFVVFSIVYEITTPGSTSDANCVELIFKPLKT